MQKKSNAWFDYLLKFDQFKNLVATQLNTYKNDILTRIDEVVDYQMYFIDNNNANFDVWQIMGVYVWPNTNEVVNIKTVDGQLNYLKNWLNQKITFMSGIYSL